MIVVQQSPAAAGRRLVRVLRGCLFLSLVVLEPVASAQDATPLDPVVITATRTPQRLTDALPSTTVVSRADIDASHAPDLATLLRGQGGIDVAQSGGLGSQTSVFLRGANSNQVLVLIDGLRVNAVGSGAASFAHLMIDQIDRVEIVRGNVSSLYGSEAVGGVIQIFTRGGSADARSGIGGRVEWGNERTRATSVDAARSFGPADATTRVGVAASYRSARGFSAIDADRVPDRQSRCGRLSQRVDLRACRAAVRRARGSVSATSRVTAICSSTTPPTTASSGCRTTGACRRTTSARV